MTAKYKTNILRGFGTTYLRDVEFLSTASVWETENEDAILTGIPNNTRAFPKKLFKQAFNLLKEAPGSISFRAIYHGKFRFNPDRATTGNTPLDVELSKLRDYVKYLTFQVLSERSVRLTNGGAAIEITTVRVIVQGESDAILATLHLSKATLWQDGQIELEEPSAGDDSA